MNGKFIFCIILFASNYILTSTLQERIAFNQEVEKRIKFSHYRDLTDMSIGGTMFTFFAWIKARQNKIWAISYEINFKETSNPFYQENCQGRTISEVIQRLSAKKNSTLTNDQKLYLRHLRFYNKWCAIFVPSLIFPMAVAYNAAQCYRYFPTQNV